MPVATCGHAKPARDETRRDETMRNERASRRTKTMTSLALAVQGKFRFVVLLVHTGGRQPVNREQVPLWLARWQAG